MTVAELEQRLAHYPATTRVRIRVEGTDKWENVDLLIDSYIIPDGTQPPSGVHLTTKRAEEAHRAVREAMEPVLGEEQDE